MDLIDLIVEKRFIGQEFLTWLWWKSNYGQINTESGPVIVLVGKKMTVDGGNTGRVVCSNNDKLAEAICAMTTGKLIEQAQFEVWHEDREYQFIISADRFDFKSVKIPRQSRIEDDSDTDGIILERIYLIQSLRNCIASLFKEFIKARLGDGWSDDVDEIRSWILAEGVAA